MPRWCSPIRRRISRTRRSPRCSCKPSSSPTAAVRCSRRGAIASRANRRSGCSTAPCWRAKVSAHCSSRPIVRVFSAVAAMRAARSPSSMRCHCPTPPAPCSIPCSRCGAGCASRPAARRASTSGPASPQAAPRRLPQPRNIARPARSSGSRWERRSRQARSLRGSRSTRTRRAYFSALPGTCSIPTARCARRSRFSPRTKRVPRFSGRAAYRGICPSCCCASRPAAVWNW